MYHYNECTMDGTASVTHNTAVTEQDNGFVYGGGVLNGVINVNAADNAGDGGIFTEDFDYANPASTSAYQNITTAATTAFSGNHAAAAYFPPDNASDFLNIGYASTSVVGPAGYIHPLNNYDINYVGACMIAFFSVT
ncbi:MAG: hypothetical protein LUG13_02865 [Oscillospiraceae bacterium]|nr:hypothetical protein [Oscillospiraceae bacterium]